MTPTSKPLLWIRVSRINFNHPDRDDPQQICMEPLELMATALGMKPAAVFGQSGYNANYLSQLEKFAARNQLHTIRTTAIPIITQMVMLKSQRISPGFISNAIAHQQSEALSQSKDQILWIFSSPALEARIRSAVTGVDSLGDLLGYPNCCVTEYLGMEEALIATELDFYSQKYGSQTDSALLIHARQAESLTGSHASDESRIKNMIRHQQAHSIRRFPFIHFIACKECLRRDDSAAALLNKAMAELALSLNKSFAMQFTDYATSYFAEYEAYAHLINHS